MTIEIDYGDGKTGTLLNLNHEDFRCTSREGGNLFKNFKETFAGRGAPTVVVRGADGSETRAVKWVIKKSDDPTTKLFKQKLKTILEKASSNAAKIIAGDHPAAGRLLNDLLAIAGQLKLDLNSKKETVFQLAKSFAEKELKSAGTKLFRSMADADIGWVELMLKAHRVELAALKDEQAAQGGLLKAHTKLHKQHKETAEEHAEKIAQLKQALAEQRAELADETAARQEGEAQLRAALEAAEADQRSALEAETAARQQGDADQRSKLEAESAARQAGEADVLSLIEDQRLR